jgi:hypothetical protein
MNLPKMVPGTVVEWWCDTVEPYAQRFRVVKPLCANAGSEEFAGRCSCALKPVAVVELPKRTRQRRASGKPPARPLVTVAIAI